MMTVAPVPHEERTIHPRQVLADATSVPHGLGGLEGRHFVF